MPFGVTGVGENNCVTFEFSGAEKSSIFCAPTPKTLRKLILLERKRSSVRWIYRFRPRRSRILFIHQF